MTCCAKLVAYTLAFAALGGCAKPSMIPNTKVRDTALNREILTVMEKYRQAMERQDAAAVLAIVHRTYQDGAGTPEGSDDVDYDGVKRLLASRFKRTSKVRYQIEYQEVRVDGAEAEVDAYIDATFVYKEPKTTARWKRLTDYNRFRLLKDGNTWRFIAGL